jgi:hypothetical protein
MDFYGKGKLFIFNSLGIEINISPGIGKVTDGT